MTLSGPQTLLHFVGARYEQAQGDLNELRFRALELIVAACVTEWVQTPKALRTSPARPVVTEDVVPKIDYDDLVPDLDEPDIDDEEDLAFPPVPSPEPERDAEFPSEPEPEKSRERTDERPWWGSSSEQAPNETPAEPVRGAWEPPRRS